MCFICAMNKRKYTLLPSFPARTKSWLARAGLHVLSQGIFTCRLYQTVFTVSAIATDSRSFILFTTYFKFNTSF